MNILKNAKTVPEASEVVLKQFENPANQSASVVVKRAQYSQSYFNKFNN
jgi:hypothetical protein